jgi:hypothetical protein
VVLSRSVEAGVIVFNLQVKYDRTPQHVKYFLVPDWPVSDMRTYQDSASTTENLDIHLNQDTCLQPLSGRIASLLEWYDPLEIITQHGRICHIQMNAILMKSRLKSVLIFLMHQLMSTAGVLVFASFLGTMVFEILGQVGLPIQMRFVHWILTETPYFPVQIGLGFFWGWLFGRRFRHRSMVWVWVVPGLLLSYVVVAVRTITPGLTSVLGQSANPFSHYLGRGCQPKNRCLDQILVTLPFYSAIAYSIGGWVGRRMAKTPSAILENSVLRQVD